MRILTPARVTVLMLLVVGGLVAFYVAKNVFAADDPTPADSQTRAVPMAVSDLKPGTIVTEAHLGLGRMPTSKFSDYPGMLLENRAIIGRVVKKPILAGTPIISSDLFDPGEIPPLQVAAGMRAVSVSLYGQTALVDGRIGPGQFVDVHMTVTDSQRTDGGNQARGGGVTLTLFKGVRVLAINSTTARALGRDNSNSVTLELTSGQANIMILAANRGEITLSYNPEGRGNGGVGVNDQNRATFEEILGMTSSNGTYEMESYRGSGRSTLQFRGGKRVDNGNRRLGSQPQPKTNTPTRTVKRPAVPSRNQRPARPRVVVGPRFGPSM